MLKARVRLLANPCFFAHCFLCVIQNNIQKANNIWKNKKDTGKMLRKICEYKEVEIIDAELSQDHIHMLVSIPPKYSVSHIT